MYGLLISLAIFICVLIAEKLIQKRNLDSTLLWSGAFWVIVFGVIGARLYHVASYYEYYSQNPIRIIDITKGGLGIFGALVAGLTTAVIYLKLKKQPVIKWLDCLAVVLPLGQAIGRWGNYFNNELYGKETNFFLGVPKNATDIKYHPLFIYESVLNLVLFSLLIKLHRNNKYKDGTILYTYTIGYGVIRFILEPLRPEAWSIYTVNVAQSIAVGFILIGLAGLIKLKHDKTK